MDISSNKQASLTLSPIISLSYELFLAASFVAGQYELFLSFNSTSYLWKSHLLCIVGNLRYCLVLLGKYLFLAMPFDIVQEEQFRNLFYSDKVICYYVI